MSDTKTRTLAEVRAKISWGMAVHTALRKGVDTDWSVLLWNMFHIIPDYDEDRLAKRDRVWLHFCTWCEKRYRETSEKPSEIIAAYVAKRDDYGVPSEERFPSSNGMTMLIFALKLCDQETLDGIDSWIGYIEEEMAGG